MKVEVLGNRVEIDSSLISESREEIRRQLSGYSAGDRENFDLEVRFPDSFTGEVMRAMTGIPYGETRTYGELAEELGTSAVAVGQACGRNPVPVIVPCHRVVAEDGIGGYQYPGLKRKLLRLEKES
ncbi:MAG: methylated-DNA--[protein]-cysteine S-methyltransferase [Candidatus Nanohaloarchaea archaeon]